MRSLLATTCLTPLILAAAPVNAQTVISDKRTTPIATSTANAGARADIRVAAAGSIVPASGVAVTIDSANSVTNEGTIQITGANDATGIRANAGTAGTITNSGKIIVDETYTAADADKDGDLDGPLAQGARRFGIRTAGAFTGNIVNSGAITVEGADSAGIALEGPLTGGLTSSGTVSVVGDRSVGVRAGDVSGNVRLSGTIGAQGAGAVGAALDDDIGGALVIQGAIGATGYRAITPPADPSKLDADDLLQGGPAVRIAGNVAGGILLEVAPKDSDPAKPDEDNDGIEDVKEGSAAILSTGAAPAIQIGAADRAVTVGAVAGNAAGHGLVINGSVLGNGAYKDVTGAGIAIGGLGGDVTVAGGMTVAGTVTARSNGASATAIRIGDGASVAEIRVTGGVGASGGGVAAAQTTAIAIEAGAAVGTIRNSGQIRAEASATAGNATAIVDRAGTVTLIENDGAITASGAAAVRNVAIDVRQSAAGVTVRQLAAATGKPAPRIAGNILFGAGNDVLDVADGSVTGSAQFGAGANRLSLAGDSAYSGDVAFGAGGDTMSLAGTSAFAGTADFGGGADTLALSGTARFSGTLAGSGGLAVTVDGGTLDLANSGTVSIASLAVASGGVIGVDIDAAAGTSTLYQVSGAATFAEGSKLAVNLANVSDSEGRYIVVRAGSVSGAANLATTGASLPYMFKSSVTTTATPGEVALDIARKTTVELGLNGSQSRAYDAVYAALDSDEDVADVFLGIGDGDGFRQTMQQMLPEHAGGTFETVTSGSRAAAGLLADPKAPLVDRGGWGFWLQQVAWGTSKSLGDTASYDISGWGASGGAEIAAGGLGRIGVSLAYLAGRDADGGTDNAVNAGQYEAAAHWRGDWGGLHGFARASIAAIDFKGRRSFTGAADGEPVSREARGEWDGRLYSAAGGFSYEARFGRFSLRPAAAVDYYRLRENAYAETGGGDALNLSVDKRTSDELAVSGTLAAALDFGDDGPDAGWFRTEIEAGRRQIVGGSLGQTTARFEGGEDFTLVPEERTSGWVGRLRASGGSDDFVIGGEFSAEEQQERLAIAFRASLQMGF